NDALGGTLGCPEAWKGMTFERWDFTWEILLWATLNTLIAAGVGSDIIPRWVLCRQVATIP
ncbi:hypothetical protein, partial [Mesorhizobium sp. LjNodule214]|uniref:hypothetical protein n=1 Tax=Mesorhizobium sp. LjNodule214 TaxID=3342252 RepID=UPI003F503515